MYIHICIVYVCAYIHIHTYIYIYIYIYMYNIRPGRGGRPQGEAPGPRPPGLGKKLGPYWVYFVPLLHVLYRLGIFTLLYVVTTREQ